MPSRRLAYKPDAATELAIEELSWISDASTLKRRAQKAKKENQKHLQKQNQIQNQNQHQIQDEQDSSTKVVIRHRNIDEILGEDVEEEQTPSNTLSRQYNNSESNTLTRQHNNQESDTLTQQYDNQPGGDFDTITRDDGVTVRQHKIQIQKQQQKKPFSRYTYDFQDGQQRSFYEEFSVGADEDTRRHTQINHQLDTLASYDPYVQPTVQSQNQRTLENGSVKPGHTDSTPTLERQRQQSIQEQTLLNTNYNTLTQRSRSSPPLNDRRSLIIPSERTRQLALAAQSTQEIIRIEQPQYDDPYDSNTEVKVRQKNNNSQGGTTKSQKKLKASQQQERKEKGKSTSSTSTGIMSFPKCSQCSGVIFGTPVKCSGCGAMAHQSDKCAHFIKKERKRDEFDWYCSSTCMTSMQQALPFYGSMQRLGANSQQLHTATIDLGSLLERKFAVWTMLAQEQFDALIMFNANIPKKHEVQHLKFTGYSLYFDEDRRNAIYAKADLKPQRFELPENKDDVLKLNGGKFSTIVISFQQRNAATVALLSRPKGAEDHGPFRERFTDWLTRLLWAMSCGWEHGRSMTPNVSARRLVLACDVNMNPPYTILKANRKTHYFKYLKPIEQRFHLRQHMTRENSALGLGKLFFTGDQLRINRSGFEQMFDEKKRHSVMVNGETPPKSPAKPPTTPQLYWCFLSTGHRSSHTPSIRSSTSMSGTQSLKSVPRSRSMPADYAVHHGSMQHQHYQQRSNHGNPLMIHSGTNTIDSRVSSDTRTQTYAAVEVNDDDENMLDGMMTAESSRFADIRELREQVDKMSQYENEEGRMAVSSTR